MDKPSAFLDRDGVINKDNGYVHSIKEFEWIDGAIETIKFIKSKGYQIFVITNQSGISREFYTSEDVILLHQYINNELRKKNTLIDDFFFSPYHPEIKNKKYEHLESLRKPNIGMLKLAELKWGVDKSKSFLIGDQETDIQCAKNYGIKGYLFNKVNLFEFISGINI